MELEGKGHALLVMDDEEMIRELARHMFGKLGFKVLTAANGEETIALYKLAWEAESPFSAVIMDLTIPAGMGGKEAARRILEMDPDARLIVSSGCSNDPAMAEYSDFGFSSAIAKPYSKAEIAMVLNDLLHKNPV